MSNQAKFTPGPWMVGLTMDGDYSVKMHTHSAVSASEFRVIDQDQAVRDADGYPLLDDGVDYSEHHYHNAHLIAAAPEMYEALEEARCTIQALVDEGYAGYVHQRCRIDKALTKARGETQ